jgi:hypothetical protein
LTIVFLNYLFATFLDEREQSRLLVVALFNQKSDVKFNRDKRLRITKYGLNVNDYIDNSQEGTVDETMLKPNYENSFTRFISICGVIEIIRGSSIGKCSFRCANNQRHHFFYGAWYFGV